MRQIIISLFLNLLITGACIAAYHHWYAPKIYTFDMRGYLQTLQKDYMSKKLSDREIDTRIKALAERIRRETGGNRNVVVLLKEVVVDSKNVKEIRP